MNKILCTLSILILPVLIVAQEPDWVNRGNRSFYDMDYFTGFSDLECSKSQIRDSLPVMKKRAMSEAVAALSRNIESTVNSWITKHTIGEGVTIQKDYLDYQITLKSDVYLIGMKEDFLHKDKSVHAFAYIRKEDAKNGYASKYRELEALMNENVERLKSMNGKGGETGLLLLTKCWTIYSEMTQSYARYQGLSDGKGSLKPPYKYGTRLDSLELAINNAIPENIDQLCEKLVTDLKPGIKSSGANTRILLQNLSFQNTGFAGELSAVVHDILSTKLAEKGLMIFDNKISESTKGYRKLTGNYREDGDYIRFSVILSDGTTGRILAGAQSRIAKRDLGTISLVPHNLDIALKNQLVFTDNELQGGGLHLDVWTNKGDASLLFREGDTMQLIVRVNHEAYLRFIYYFEDGRRTLLNEYYIPPDLVNKVTILPTTFECKPPFGIETLQVMALTKPFERINTYKGADGYFYITDDANTITRTFRGFQPKNSQELIAEKRLTITTLAKPEK